MWCEILCECTYQVAYSQIISNSLSNMPGFQVAVFYLCAREQHSVWSVYKCFMCRKIKSNKRQWNSAIEINLALMLLNDVACSAAVEGLFVFIWDCGGCVFPLLCVNIDVLFGGNWGQALCAWWDFCCVSWLCYPGGEKPFIGYEHTFISEH